MKYINLLLLSFLLVLTSCESTGDGPQVVSIEGREPEVVTWVSGQRWIPPVIAILIEDEETNQILLSASSNTHKGYQRTLNLLIRDADFEWPPSDSLDLLSTASPVQVEVEYKQFRDKDNQQASLWQGHTNEQGGMIITHIEEEDDIEYARGSFFMDPYLFIDRPTTQSIEGLFNNVRVFRDAASFNDYFSKVNALAEALDN
jgi:hypothetical protein